MFLTRSSEKYRRNKRNRVLGPVVIMVNVNIGCCLKMATFGGKILKLLYNFAILQKFGFSFFFKILFKPRAKS